MAEGASDLQSAIISSPRSPWYLDGDVVLRRPPGASIRSLGLGVRSGCPQFPAAARCVRQRGADCRWLRSTPCHLRGSLIPATPGDPKPQAIGRATEGFSRGGLALGSIAAGARAEALEMGLERALILGVCTLI